MRAWVKLGIVTFAFVSAISSAHAIYYGGRELSPRELEYQCSLGSQTPYSLRQYCRGGYRGGGERFYRYEGPRYGGGGYGGYGEYGGRRLSYRELQYQCSLGRQTPYTLRDFCRRHGFW